VLNYWQSGFDSAAGALPEPWGSWLSSLTEIDAQINASGRAYDPGGNPSKTSNYLKGKPFYGRVKTRVMVPVKYNGALNDGGTDSSDVALDFAIDPVTGNSYRWQIDSNFGSLLRLWKSLNHFTSSVELMTAIAYVLQSGQGLWQTYDPSTGVIEVGVVELNGGETSIAKVRDTGAALSVPALAPGGVGFGIEKTGSTSSEVENYEVWLLDNIYPEPAQPLLMKMGR
jgi:hypothetical protein